MSFDGDLYPTAGATSVLTTKGDMVDFDAIRQRLAIGSANQILQVKSSLPSWQTVPLADTVLTTAGDVLYEDATPALARLASGTQYNNLQMGATLPAWSASSTSVLTTTGDLLYASASNTLARLAGGTSGDVLTANGAGVAPSYQTPSAGGGGKLTLISRTEVSSGTTIDSSFTSESGDNISSLVCYYDIQRDNVTADMQLQYGSGGSLVTSAYYTSSLALSGTHVWSNNVATWLLARGSNYRHFSGMAQIYVGDSDQTTYNSDIIFSSFSTNTNPEGYLSGGTRDGTENSIDQVKFSISAGALQAGSVMTLYSVDST